MTWWNRLLRRNEMDQQLDKELRFHLDQHAADKFSAPPAALIPCAPCAKTRAFYAISPTLLRPTLG